MAHSKIKVVAADETPNLLTFSFRLKLKFVFLKHQKTKAKSGFYKSI